MTHEARLVTKEEVISILEGIQEEVRSGKTRGLQVLLQDIISTDSPSPHIMTATLLGKQYIINLSYEE